MAPSTLPCARYHRQFGISTPTPAATPTPCLGYRWFGNVKQIDTETGNFTASHEYAFCTDLGGGLFAPNRVRTTTCTPTGNVSSEDRYDGQGRKFETLRVGQNGPRNPIRATTQFNDRGAAWRTSFPHGQTEAGSEHWRTTVLENDDPVTPTAEWAQMGLNRPVKTREELNSTDSGSYAWWRTGG